MLASVEHLVTAADLPETRLPESRPLTLTRNFVWVFLICAAAVVAVPVVVAWTASVLLL